MPVSPPTGTMPWGMPFRAWCRTEDYWDVYYDLLEELKSAFDAAGLSIPYPQMEVTLRK